MTRTARRDVQTLILRERSELDLAQEGVRRRGLSRATTPEKEWDNWLALTALDGLQDAPVADLGCRSGILLTWLHQSGFRRLYGCDLRWPVPPIREAARKMMWDTVRAGIAMYARNWRRMKRAPVERTGFPANHFAAVASMSVIEHGVDVPRFYAEAYRLLRPGGLLIVSTDYWPERVEMLGSRLWQREDIVFDAAGLTNLIRSARDAGFEAADSDLEAGEPLVSFDGRSYTFAYLVVRKPDPSGSAIQAGH